MTTVEDVFSTLCYHAGITATWDTADDSCYSNFHASLCTLRQWRLAICRAGIASPGASWTHDVAGASTFARVSACTSDGVDTAVYTTMLKGPCCLEWMKY